MTSPWTALDLHPDVVAGVVVLAVAWVAVWRRSGRPVAARHAIAFSAALAVLLATLNGPLHALADGYLFSAHMVQHLALTLLVPPLAIAGTPGWMVDAALSSSNNRPSPVLGPIARRLTRPIAALAAYTIVLVAWHLPAPYDAALEHHALHVVQHVTLVAGSVLAWWPVVSSSRLLPPLPYGAQLLYLFVFGMPMTIVAAMVTGAENVLYGFYAEAPRVSGLGPLEDQRLGGVIMWVPAGIIPVIAFTLVFFRWVRSEPDDEAAADTAPPAP
ncbi:MAG: cytochrome c oxidase assembly protein [Candidatus Rokubacteria bacterium]|nr:cytochrome c oxidase assembly protein [Candidatus Rokubacteria bacterium]